MPMTEYASVFPSTVTGLAHASLTMSMNSHTVAAVSPHLRSSQFSNTQGLSSVAVRNDTRRDRDAAPPPPPQGTYRRGGHLPDP